MAFNKNKVIALAQKYIQKGQLDRAIAEYEKILDEDKKDIRTRLKIGDLYAKKGDNPGAAKVYQDVAESYSKDGFYLKAVAVYKNILKLCPDLIEVNLKLGDLYHQLSLLGDAMSQYQIVVNYYDKNGMVKESLDTLKKMVELDPENITFKINLAELYHKEGHVAQAQTEFDAIATDLKDAGNLEELAKVYERILHHNPDRTDISRDLADCYLKQNLAQKALTKLQLCFKADPKDTKTLELLSQAFLQLNQPKKAKSVLKELLQIFEAANDSDGKARVQQQMAQISPEEASSPAIVAPPEEEPVEEAPAPPPAANMPAEVKSYDEEVTQFSVHTGEVALDGGPLGAASPLDAGPLDDNPLAGGPMEVEKPKAPPPPAAPDVPDSIVDLGAEVVEEEEEDLDEVIAKLMTETEVYLKYGLNDKAKEHLEQIISKRPKHEEARVKLKGLLQSLGDQEGAVKLLQELVALSAEHPDRQQKYKAELQTLAPSSEGASEGLSPPSETAAPAGEALQVDFELGGESGDISLPPIETPPIEMAPDVSPQVELPPEPPAAASAAPASGPMIDLDLGIEIEVSEPAIETPPPPTAVPVVEAPVNLEDSSPAISIAPYQAPDAEEVAVEDVSVEDLGLPSAEIDMSLDDSPTLPMEVISAAEAAQPEADLSEVSSAASSIEMVEQAPAEIPVEVREELDEADFFVQQGLHDEARKIYEDLAERFPNHSGVQAEISAKLGGVPRTTAAEAVKVAIKAPVAAKPAAAKASDLARDIERVVAKPPPPAPPPAPVVPEPVEIDDEPMFDLAAELSQELESYSEPAATPAAPTTDQVDFKEVFEEFKKGVAKQLGKEDSETHFDLGLAYKEMQLYDDAINEFQIAMADSGKVVECYTMIGLCFMDKGEFDKACDYFKQGLAWKSISTQEVLGLNYELGLAQQAAGRSAEALVAFNRAHKMDPHFRDVGERIEAMKRESTGAQEPMAKAVEEVFDLGADLAQDDEEILPMPTRTPSKPASRKPAPKAPPEPPPDSEAELTDLSAFDTPSEKVLKKPGDKPRQPTVKTEKTARPGKPAKSKISYV